jgi:DNA polymerase IV
MPATYLEARFGRSAAHLAALASGLDDRPVEPFSVPKSMGAEETFGRDHSDLERLKATLRGQAERVARELRAEGLAGRTVTLKLRFADFSTITRSRTDDPTHDGLRIYEAVTALLARVTLRQLVRLIVLSVSGLTKGEGQLPLLGPDTARRERLARALDRLVDRFGEDSIRPASVLRRQRRPGSEPGADSQHD